MTRNICMVTQSIMVLLLILFSSALLLVHDDKYIYGNPVNSGTIINLIFAGLTLSSCREIYVW
jgi:intracellular septation protein A